MESLFGLHLVGYQLPSARIMVQQNGLRFPLLPQRFQLRIRGGSPKEAVSARIAYGALQLFDAKDRLLERIPSQRLVPDSFY